MKILKPDFQMDSKVMRFGRQVHAEIYHERTYQTFRTWIMKDGKREGDIKTLHLEGGWYNPEEYVKNFIEEIEEEEAKIK